MLRSLKSSDMPAIRDINETSLGYSVTLELTQTHFMKLSNSEDHILIGFEEDSSQEIVGYIHAEIYESLYSEPGLNILALAVLPDYQGHGIGRELLLALEEVALERGFSFIRLNSASHRKEAHAFYRKMNYIDDKTQLRFIKEL